MESFVTKRRDTKAALKFVKKTMRRYGQPLAIVTDLLRSYGAALKEIGAADLQETGRWLNNRAGNPHLPFRRREWAMQRFRSTRSLQRFVAVHASVHNHFNSERSLSSRVDFKKADLTQPSSNSAMLGRADLQNRHEGHQEQRISTENSGQVVLRLLSHFHIKTTLNVVQV